MIALRYKLKMFTGTFRNDDFITTALIAFQDSKTSPNEIKRQAVVAQRFLTLLF